MPDPADTAEAGTPLQVGDLVAGTDGTEPLPPTVAGGKTHQLEPRSEPCPSVDDVLGELGLSGSLVVSGVHSHPSQLDRLPLLSGDEPFCEDDGLLWLKRPGSGWLFVAAPVRIAQLSDAASLSIRVLGDALGWGLEPELAVTCLRQVGSPDAEVRLFSLQPSRAPLDVTDLAAGTYEVSLTVVGARAGGVSQEVDLASGQHADVTVELPQVGSTFDVVLSLTVSDAWRRYWPDEGVEARIRPVDAPGALADLSWEVPAEGASDRFSLIAGRYVVDLEGPFQIPFDVEGPGPIDLALAPPGEVHFFFDSGSPPTDLVVEARVADHGSGGEPAVWHTFEGRVWLPLPPGEWELVLRTPDRSLSHVFQARVVSGRQRRFDVTPLSD